MKVEAGDIIGIRYWTPEGCKSEMNLFYLITKTRNHFRYEAICLNDGMTTSVDKSYIQQYGVKVA